MCSHEGDEGLPICRFSREERGLGLDAAKVDAIGRGHTMRQAVRQVAVQKAGSESLFGSMQPVCTGLR